MSPAPYGVSVDVWVHDQVGRVERILLSLEGVSMTDFEMERLERALERAHRQNLGRVTQYRVPEEQT